MPDPDTSAVLALLELLQPALQRQDRALLVELIARLLELRAPMGPQWLALARIAAGLGELLLSRAAADLFVEAAGHAPGALYQKAALLTESGDWTGAFAILERLPADTPDPAANAYSRGSSLLMLGRLGEAREVLKRAVQLRPHSGAAWLGLAMASDLAREEAIADAIIVAEDGMERAAPLDRAPYLFALGHAHAVRGRHEAAFAAVTAGGELRRRAFPYDRAADRREAEQAARGYTAQGLRTLAAQQSEPTGRTIFVTGLPRSGTTLVEQILTSHSEVADGGEIARLELLAREVGGASSEALERHVATGRAPEAARLWDHWLTERFPAPGRIVDKTLGNSRLLGLAAGLLPDAPLVWVTRDPLDRAWSCLRTWFTGSHEWSYDQADLAHHFRLEDALLARWRELLGERLLVLAYEDLVSDPEPQIRRLLAHCGLAEEPQVFAPQANPRAVVTASTAQVRRPISREAVGSAAPYRAFLEPFLAAYKG